MNETNAMNFIFSSPAEVGSCGHLVLISNAGRKLSRTRRRHLSLAAITMMERAAGHMLKTETALDLVRRERDGEVIKLNEFIFSDLFTLGI